MKNFYLTQERRTDIDFPDKIYAYFSFPNISGHLRSRMWCIDPVGLGENIEYIRKDALLEHIKQEQEELKLRDDYEEGRFDALVDVIEKIESL